MILHQPPLILAENNITDARQTISLEQLPDPQPQCRLRLEETTPLMERLWRVALADCEKNIVRAGDADYFGAGANYSVRVYTRDISYSGVLGLNQVYPDMMLNSIKHTRRIREQLGFHVSRGYTVDEINVEWCEEDIREGDFLKKYHTNSYSRRTDDVIWLWCAADLLERQGWADEWQWLYETGNRFFETFYQPFYDVTDGLYYGQASFIDVHDLHHRGTGYPEGWSIADCILVKSLSTNCLYVLGLEAMARAAIHLKRGREAAEWSQKAIDLREAVNRELRFDNGTYAYLKEHGGGLQPRREALGTALAVLSRVANSVDAELALAGHPVSDGGVPLLHPFFPHERWYHNNSSWPFVDTFFLQAKEMAERRDYTALNTALLARTCIEDGTFHEVTDYRTREIKGSGSQLWSAAAFVNTCLRAQIPTGLAHQAG